jgi:dephospho-CoA kinase
MKKIGITGGIGAGKTLVCRIFEAIGIPVFYADEEAKQIMVNEPAVISEIKDLLGVQAYDTSGGLNRKWISDKVFADPGLLLQLQKIVHPRVHSKFEQWTAGQKQDISYVLEEAALLVENKIYLQLDALIVVVCPEEARIRRVMERDNMSREEVIQRIRRQLPEEQKTAVANYLIVNDGMQSLIKQVMDVHRRISSAVTD